MKNALSALALVTLLLSGLTLFAQRPDGNGRMDPAAMKQKLMDSLQMTSPQADSVLAIRQEFGPKMREVFSDQSLSQEDRRAKLGEINQQRSKRLQAVLGDELLKKYQEYEQRNRPQRGAGGMGRPNQ